jgi:hypothetical protein
MMYLHSPIRLHGIVLSYILQYSGDIILQPLKDERGKGINKEWKRE